MGWLFGYNTRRELAEHLIRGNGVHTLKHCWVGNNLWAVQEGEKQDGSVVRFVALYLIKGRNNSRDGWGYKDVDESMGPYETSCPVSYIELVEAHEKERGYEPAGYAAEWRQKVRDRAVRAKRKLEVGQDIRLGDTEYRVVEKLGNRGYRVDDGHTYFRLSRSQARYAEIVK